MKLLDDISSRLENVTSLAEGGQKKVLAADHDEHGPVVVKHGEYRFATTLERITREVQLLSDLDSPYYPKHFEFLVEPVRRQFLVIEERLDATPLSDNHSLFDTDDAILGLLRELVCALQVIWSRNVVHRDLKPANILITPQGQPRIIDLGIARFLDDTSLTASMAAMGPATPIYAAPEQLLNRKAMINVRTDFFLLGIVILELMHGFHPFDPNHVGGNASLLDNILKGRFVAPPQDRDQTLVAFVERVLEPQPFKRHRTVEALASAIGADLNIC